MTETQRTFICVEIPEPDRQRIAALHARFPPESKGVRWVRQQLLHLTLRFLGNLTADEVDAVITATETVAATTLVFQIGVGGLGAFPSCKRPKTIWTAVSEGARELRFMSKLLDGALTQSGVSTGENDRFHPHITLGRVRQGADRDQIRMISSTLESESSRSQCVAGFPVDHLTVMASVLGREGPAYTPLSMLPLLGSRRRSQGR